MAIAAVLKDTQISTLRCAVLATSSAPYLHSAYTECSVPDEHFEHAAPRPRGSLASNSIGGYIVEDENGDEEFVSTLEGITALCEGLTGSAVTSLT